MIENAQDVSTSSDFFEQIAGEISSSFLLPKIDNLDMSLSLVPVPVPVPISIEQDREIVSFETSRDEKAAATCTATAARTVTSDDDTSIPSIQDESCTGTSRGELVQSHQLSTIANMDESTKICITNDTRKESVCFQKWRPIAYENMKKRSYLKDYEVKAKQWYDLSARKDIFYQENGDGMNTWHNNPLLEVPVPLEKELHSISPLTLLLTFQGEDSFGEDSLGLEDTTASFLLSLSFDTDTNSYEDSKTSQRRGEVSNYLQLQLLYKE